MSVVLTRVDPDNFILNDGMKIVICKPEMDWRVTTAEISETLAGAIYKVLTSFDLALRLKKNYQSKPANQYINVNDDSATLDNISGAVLSLNNTARIDSTVLFVSSYIGNVRITGETLVTLMKVLKDAGAEADPTYGVYKDIRFVIEPPTPITMEDGMVYVLAVDYKGFTAGTCFIMSKDEDGNIIRNIFDTKTGELTPAAYGNPEDASTYPKKDTYTEDDAVTGTVGDADSATVEVFAKQLTETTTITACESVNLVNDLMVDSAIKVTIA